MLVERCRTLKVWNYFWDLFLCDPWFLRKDLRLLLKAIWLFINLWGLWWLYGMSWRVMARAAYQPFLCVIPLWRKVLSRRIPNTEAENRSTRSGRSLYSPLSDWVHSLFPPLSWHLKKPSSFRDVICHWKCLDKIRSLFEIKLAKGVGEAVYKWVIFVFPIEASVVL